MESSIMRNASRFLREQKKKRKWQKVLACLALVVAAGTTIALIMPGQALNSTEKVLDCQIEVHQHTADCYAEDGTTLICGLADYVAHTHNELCYNEEGELICKLPEMPAHQHTADCYAEERVLTCGLEETPENGEGIPVSGGDQENAAPHVHTDECYTTVSHLICGQLEAVEHVHTDACFKEVTVDGEEESTDETLNDTEVTDVSPGDLAALEDEWYFCGKSAHTHSDECYDEDSNLVCGLEEHVHTEECLNETELICELEEHKHDASCYDENGNIVCGLEEHKHVIKCFKVYWCGIPAHIHNAACYAGMDVTSGDMEGTLRCGLEEHVHDDTCLIVPLQQRIYTDDSIRVTATYPATAGIPEEAEFRVKRITMEDSPEHYMNRYFDIQNILREEYPEMVALLNVGFFLEDGTEVEPLEPVEVTLQFLDREGLAVGDSITLIHFADSGVEVFDDINVDTDATATITMDEFSDLAAINNPSGSEGTPPDDENFEHKKQIDYLFGEQKNPDTELTGDDKYRIYLDMVGRSRPMNVLFVVDRSNSMTTNLTDGVRRDKAVYNLVAANDGLIKEFLSRNEGKSAGQQSYVAMAWFGGKYPGYGNEKDYLNGSKDDVKTNTLGYGSRSYRDDSGPVFDWTNNMSEVNLRYDANNMTSTDGYVQALKQANNMEGTNYCSGLMYASYMLHNMPEAARNNETVVIFISDGVPTYFYMASDFRAKNLEANVTRYGEAIERKSVLCRSGLRNWSNGNSVSGYGSKYGFYTATENFFDAFMNANSNVKFFTVGIGDNLSSYNPYTAYDDDTRQSWMETSVSRSTVLDYMTANGNSGRTTMFTANSSDQLRSAIKEIIFPDNVVITDKLSDYVDFYKENSKLDVLVTARNNNTRDVITLWKGSEIAANNVVGKATGTNTIDGKKVINNVSIVGKTITATFEPTYELSPDYTYTLSFNVELTEAAFDAYARNGNYSSMKGESNTDYGNNHTSSNMPGFYSNSEATVSYKVDGGSHTLPYDDPVVQTWKTQLKLVKKDQDEHVMPNVQFKLLRGTSVVGKDGEDKPPEWYKTDANGSLLFTVLEHGSYELIENVPEGYENGGKTKVVLTFTVAGGRITSVKDAEGNSLSTTCDPDDEIGSSVTNRTYTYSVEVKNTKLDVPVKVKKEDTAHNPLEGVIFGIFTKDPDVNRELEPIATGTSKENGYVQWSNVNTAYCRVDKNGDLYLGLYLEGNQYRGDYYLKEMSSINGYSIVEGSILFTVTGTGKLTLNCVGDREPTAGTEEWKRWYFDGSTATITVVNKPNNVKVQFTKKGKDGTTDGVILSDEANFKDAVFEIYKSDGTLVATGNVANEKYILWSLAGSTDGGLTQILSLPEGDYYLREVQAPNGYEKFGADMYFSVKLENGKMIVKESDSNSSDIPWDIVTVPGGDGIFTVSVWDEPTKFKVIVKKVDGFGNALYGDDILNGATFVVYSTSDRDNPVATGVSDVAGVVIWTLSDGTTLENNTELTLIPGDYILTESIPPVRKDGFVYEGLEAEIPFKVSIDPEQEGGLVLTCEEDTNTPKRWSVNKEGSGENLALSLTVTNVQQFIDLMILKYGDSYTAASEENALTPIAGAYFKLYKWVGDEPYSYQGTNWTSAFEGNIRSEEDGYITFVPAEVGAAPVKALRLAFGMYRLEETEAPEGYNKLKTPIDFAIIPDEKTGLGRIIILNKPNIGDYAAGIVQVENREEDGLTITLKVTNNMGAELPKTGGFGVYPYMLSGLTIALVAIIALIYKKRSITN